MSTKNLALAMLPLFMPTTLNVFDEYERQFPIPKVETPNKNLLRKLEQQNNSRKNKKNKKNKRHVTIR